MSLNWDAEDPVGNTFNPIKEKSDMGKCFPLPEYMNRAGFLKDLPVQGMVHNQQFSVAGFYKDSSVGGGIFIFQVDVSKSTHNGGTVVAPEALEVWAGTQSDIATLLNWTGSGLGCYVRQKTNNNIFVSEFGGIEGGDNTTPLQAACNSGETVVDDFNKSFLSDTIFVNDKNLDLTLGDVTQTVAGRVLAYDAGIDFIRPASSINYTTRTISFDTTGVQEGDLLKLISDDRLVGTRPIEADGRMSRRGQYVTVLSVSSGSAVVMEALRYEFTTNVRVAKLKRNKLKIKAKRLSFDAQVSGAHSALWVMNGAHHEFDVEFGRLPFIGINLLGCYMPNVKRAHFLRSSISNPNGHGVSDWSCYGTNCEHLSAEYLRHLFTTNQSPIDSNSSEVWYYGPSYGGTVRAAQGGGGYSTWMDTHHGCEDFTFYGGNYVGRSSAIGLRGRRITWFNAQINGAQNGIFAYSEITLDPSDYSEDIVFINPVIRNIVQQPIRAQRVARMVVVEPMINTDKSFNIGQLISADVTLIDPQIILDGSSENERSAFLLQDGSSLTINGDAEVFINNHTGSAPRLISMTGNQKQSAIINKIRVHNRGQDMSLRVINNVGSVAADVRVKAVLNHIGDYNLNGLVDELSSVDVTGGSLARTSRRRIGTVNSETVIFDGIIPSYGFILFETVVPGGHGDEVQIAGIAAGRVDGQRLAVRNSSAGTLIIPETSTINNNPTGPISLGPRDSVIYYWSAQAGRWIQIAKN